MVTISVLGLLMARFIMAVAVLLVSVKLTLCELVVWSGNRFRG